MSSGPIQQQPGGLLDFLQLKNQGRNPSQLGDTVTPVLVMNDWYRGDTVVAVGGLTGLASAQVYAGYENIGGMQVPADEVWRVRDYCVGIRVDLGSVTAVEIYTLAAAVQYLQEDPFYGPAGNGQNKMVGPHRPSFDSTLTGPLPTVGNQWLSESLRDFWAPPFMFFGYEFNGVITDAVGAISVEGYARVEKMKY